MKTRFRNTNTVSNIVDNISKGQVRILPQVANNLYAKDGKIGINTTSPEYDLDVNGDLRVTGNINLEGAITASIGNFTIKDHDLLDGLTDDDHTNYALLAGRSGGQTIIGGLASGDDLTLQSTAHATKGSILFGTSVYNEVNNKLGLGGSVSAARLKSYKNFGDSHSTNLSLSAEGDAQGEVVGLSFYPTFEGTADNGPRRAADISAGFDGGAWATQYMAFHVGNSTNDVGAATPEVMRITNDRNVGIGTTSPTATLDVYADASANSAGKFHNDGNGANRWGLQILAGLDSPATTGDIYWNVLKDGNGTERSYLRFQSTSPYSQLSATSDEKLKYDIQDSTVDGLAVIKGIKLRKFKWKNRDPKTKHHDPDIDYVAQEVQPIVPEMVGMLPNGYLGVGDSCLIKYLVKAVQQLSDKIDLLEKDKS